MLKNVFLSVLTITLFLTTGCAIMQPVKPEMALTHPLGTDSLKTGMTKDQVKSLLGEPDTIVPMERSKDVLGTEREEWIYHGRYSNLPVNADYLGKDMHLIFDGNNLTSYKSTE